MIGLWPEVGMDSCFNRLLDSLQDVAPGLRNQEKEADRVCEKAGCQEQDASGKDGTTLHDVVRGGNSLTDVSLDFPENGKPLKAHQVGPQDAREND